MTLLSSDPVAAVASLLDQLEGEEEQPSPDLVQQLLPLLVALKSRGRELAGHQLDTIVDRLRELCRNTRQQCQ